MTERWFKVFDGLLDDPKIQCISPLHFKHLINLWCMSARFDGTLPDVSRVAYLLRVDEEEASNVLNYLTNQGLIDRDGDGSMRPHNWNGRQKNVRSTERVRKHRNARKHKETPETIKSRVEESRGEEIKKESKMSPAATEKKSVSHETPPDTAYKDARHELWAEGQIILDQLGEGKKAKAMIGRWLKLTGDNVEATMRALRSAEREQPMDPITWVTRALGPQIKGARNGKSGFAGTQAAIDNLRRKLRPGPPHSGDFGVSSGDVSGGVPDPGWSDPGEVSS